MCADLVVRVRYVDSVGRAIRPKVDGFCSLCGDEASTDHYDEGGWSIDGFCPICGDISCLEHGDEVSYRLYCEACAGCLTPNEVSQALYPKLIKGPYEIGCDGCLDKIEPVAREDPVFHLVSSLLLDGGYSPTSAVEAAQLIVGDTK